MLVVGRRSLPIIHLQGMGKGDCVDGRHQNHVWLCCVDERPMNYQEYSRRIMLRTMRRSCRACGYGRRYLQCEVLAGEISDCQAFTD